MRLAAQEIRSRGADGGGGSTRGDRRRAGDRAGGSHRRARGAGSGSRGRSALADTAAARHGGEATADSGRPRRARCAATARPSARRTIRSRAMPPRCSTTARIAVVQADGAGVLLRLGGGRGSRRVQADQVRSRTRGSRVAVGDGRVATARGDQHGRHREDHARRQSRPRSGDPIHAERQDERHVHDGREPPISPIKSGSSRSGRTGIA